MRLASALFFLILLGFSAGRAADGAASIPTAPAVPAPSATVTSPQAEVAANSTRPPARSQRADFLFLPNGWGSTPAQARLDLDRVMAIDADKPGFYRYPYVKIVQVGRNSYEADGMCTWNAADVLRATDPRHNNR